MSFIIWGDILWVIYYAKFENDTCNTNVIWGEADHPSSDQP